MLNSPSVEDRILELDRNAYNAAFHELGFRWHWDSDTYDYLLSRNRDPAEQIRHYLQTSQPHLLTAYEVVFLVQLIREKQVSHRRRQAARGDAAAAHFDWSQTLGGEIGA
ncbi:MAG: hypothetical protein ABI330_21060 [Caldimonas sp.]